MFFCSPAEASDATGGPNHQRLAYFSEVAHSASMSGRFNER